MLLPDALDLAVVGVDLHEREAAEGAFPLAGRRERHDPERLGRDALAEQPAGDGAPDLPDEPEVLPDVPDAPPPEED